MSSRRNGFTPTPQRGGLASPAGIKTAPRLVSGFTLIELLIVIGILAVLATITVLVLNPAQLFAQARDSQRITELQTINRALQFAQLEGVTAFGTAQTVYVSIPDTSPTCANLSLPPLTSGWLYACKDAASYRLPNGAGWMPVNFSGLTSGGLSILPVDPVNTVVGDYYYTYLAGSWALTARFESTKYISEKAGTDDGADSNRIELGTEKALWAQSGAPTGGGGANTAPTAAGTSVTTAYNTPTTITLAATDPEQCELTFSALTSPANGTLGLVTGQTCVTGLPRADSATITYTPTSGFSGNNSFAFRVNDGTYDSNSATVSITVSAPGNTPPTALNKIPTVTSGVATAITLSGTDPDECNLTFSIVAGPTNGTLGIISNQSCTAGSPNSDDATVTYTSTGGFTGSDSFTYKVNDGIIDSGTATVSITVSGPTPTVSDPSPTIRGQGAISQSITITGTNFASGATASFSGSGITVNSTTFVSATQLTANITIASGATTGGRTITVTNLGGAQGSCSGTCFTVNASPTVSSPVSPASMDRGLSNQTMTISGSGFVSGGSLATAFSGSGITVNSTTYVNSTTITANITIASNAAGTARDVTVTNGDGGVKTATSAFTVTISPTVYTSCKELLDNEPGTPDGNYQIKPDANPAFTVNCDMTNGGWTRIATLVSGGSPTNLALDKGVTFNKVRAVRASNHACSQDICRKEATFSSTQTADTGLTATATNGAKFYLNVNSAGQVGYGLYGNINGVCNWDSSNIHIIGVGYQGGCPVSTVGLTIGSGLGSGHPGAHNYNLAEAFDVDIYVMLQ